ncbi:MAG: DNA mismatch repair protein MutL [Candidatus Hydrogenedentota bacterium]
MAAKLSIPPVRVLPETVANKIAAGEVVERPASVVKELVENALDARASLISVRLVAAGRRTIEVTDNGHGMSEQDAMLAVERHATSKIRKAEDLDNIVTLGFRGEALASIAAVSKFELVTRREKDEAGTRIRIEGGVLRSVDKIAAPVGTRISVNRLYFNTPVRAKFLKGMATELSQAIDVVQRHALAVRNTGFRLLHNEKPLLEVPDHASLRERVALVWGLGFLKDLVDLNGEHAGIHVHGLIGSPVLSRSQRSHQYFFLNSRPVVNRSMQYGFEEGYRELLTIGRRPVGILFVDIHPRLVDVNIHPAKREVRFRDERVVRETVRDLVRVRLERLLEKQVTHTLEDSHTLSAGSTLQAKAEVAITDSREPSEVERPAYRHETPILDREPAGSVFQKYAEPVQTGIPGIGAAADIDSVALAPVYRPMAMAEEAPLQLFDTYLLLPEDDRLLIIDQHALHERITYDSLRADLEESDYASQQLAVPLLVEVPPSHVRLLESNRDLFARLGIEIEPFGGNTFQVTSICHLYDESAVPDAVYRVLDALAQGDLFSREDFMSDLLRLTVEACRGSVKAGDRLSPQERRELVEGFKRLRPPYTCPHGRPIITELTVTQMEKSFRRRQ